MDHDWDFEVRRVIWLRYRCKRCGAQVVVRENEPPNPKGPVNDRNEADQNTSADDACGQNVARQTHQS